MSDNKLSKKRHPKTGLKEVYTAWGLAEGEVIKSLLQSYGISCTFLSQVAHSIHPFSVDGLGKVKIMVTEEDYNQAKELIEKSSKEK
ncbi:MAG: DUF2007 domain-containing protein [Candidatus Aminicenantia bacterium]